MAFRRGPVQSVATLTPGATGGAARRGWSAPGTGGEGFGPGGDGLVVRADVIGGLDPAIAQRPTSRAVAAGTRVVSRVVPRTGPVETETALVVRRTGAGVAARVAAGVAAGGTVARGEAVLVRLEAALARFDAAVVEESPVQIRERQKRSRIARRGDEVARARDTGDGEGR